MLRNINISLRNKKHCAILLTFTFAMFLSSLFGLVFLHILSSQTIASKAETARSIQNQSEANKYNNEETSIHTNLVKTEKEDALKTNDKLKDTFPKIDDEPKNNNAIVKTGNKDRNNIDISNHIILKSGILDKVINEVREFFKSPKFKSVFRGVTDCFVNGVMDLASYHLPAIFLPVFSKFISYIFPIESIVTLQSRMPVSMYRRALNTAVNQFVGAFDRFKYDNLIEPYMTRRANKLKQYDQPDNFNYFKK